MGVTIGGLFWALLLSSTCLRCVLLDVYSTERSLLLAIEAQIDNWSDFKTGNNLTGWDSSTPVCTWSGIRCNSLGMVSEINLGCHGCVKQAIGRIAPELGSFTALGKIDISNQFMTGPLPSAWSNSGAMQELKSLNLSWNHMTGTLPPWGNPGAFPALLALDVNHNQFTGVLPPSWGSDAIFQQLLSLDISHNSLGAGLPEAWGEDPAWPQLQLLDLSSNNLSGTIPDTWAENEGFLALQQLKLSHNSLEGPVPVGFGDPPAALTYLDLSSNLFSGSLPTNWSDSGLSNLTQLFLGECNFSGTLPAAWALPSAFPSLQTLDVHSNSLEGGLPASWASQGSFPKLRTLNLANNWLFGNLEDAWGNPGALPALEDLFLAYNAFHGGLPAAWGRNGSFPSLSNLDLSSNCLTGTLPSSWGGAFPNLANVSLVWNRLSGSIPPSWGGLDSLSTLWLQPGNYQLCGGLPAKSGAELCKTLGPTCVKETSLGNTCSFSPTTAAMYLPPSTNTTSLQATLRMKGSTAVSANAVDASLGYAAHYLVTAAASATVVALTRPVSQATPFFQPASSGSRRLLQISEDSSTSSVQSKGARRMLASSPGPSAAMGDILDAVVQFTANTGSDVYTMEEQLLTVIASNALLNVLATNGVRLSSVEVLAMEPASQADVPGWWKSQVNWDSPPSIEAEGPDVVFPDLTSPAGVSTASSAKAKVDGDRPVVVVPAVVGSVALALIITLPLLFLWLRRIRRRREEEATSKSSAPSEVSEHPIPTPPGSSGLAQRPISEADSGGSPALAVLQRRSVLPNGGEADDGGGPAFSLPAMPWSDWEISPADIQICRRPNGQEWELGSGSFGKVYKAMRSGTQPVAVKILHQREDCPDFGREIALLRAMRHSNIVAFQGVCTQEGRVMLVTEFMEGGDLFRALSNASARKLLAWSCCGRNVAIDVARGLDFLHSRNVIHVDVKSANVLLSREGQAKLTDVGLSRITEDGYVSKVSDVVGTFAWAAPELLLGRRCSLSADIYSFGVLLWELAVTSATGERPQRGQMREVSVPEELPAEVEELRQACMDLDPKNRPTAREIYTTLSSQR